MLLFLVEERGVPIEQEFRGMRGLLSICSNRKIMEVIE